MAGMKRLLLAMLCALLSGAVLADLADEVRCREIGFSKAAEARDMATFRTFIDADARFVSSGVLRGVTAIVEAWSVFFAGDGPAIKWRPLVIEVLEDRDLALTRGPYRVVSEDAEGNRVEHWGTFNSVWRLGNDGEWRVVFDAGSPAATAPDEETRAFLDAGDDCP
jgi:ketosteroid isomerase-like protein